MPNANSTADRSIYQWCDCLRRRHHRVCSINDTIISTVSIVLARTAAFAVAPPSSRYNRATTVLPPLCRTIISPLSSYRKMCPREKHPRVRRSTYRGGKGGREGGILSSGTTGGLSIV